MTINRGCNTKQLRSVPAVPAAYRSIADLTRCLDNWTG